MTAPVIELCSNALCLRTARFVITHPRLRGQRILLCEACADARGAELRAVGAELEPIELGTQGDLDFGGRS